MAYGVRSYLGNMPSHPIASDSSPIATRLRTGATAFASLWRLWRKQWSQPQLLKLSDAYHGIRIFHSSQMGGFANGSLRDPAPKVFLSVGYLNLAHARSILYDPNLIEDAPDIGLPAKLPGALRSLWEGRQPLCDANGVALGPVGLFEAFTGLRELSYRSDRNLAPEHAQAASSALGKWLRLRLASQGVDWLSELPAYRQRCDAIEPLLMGHDLDADRLVYRLPQIAEIAHSTDEELWGVIEEAVAATDVAR
jgi:hypothetical protein